MPDLSNPYIAGSPVTGPEMFFGRHDIFEFIQKTLSGQHRDHVVVLYGQRRTGKTSVLYQMGRHLDPRYLCIFIDLHGLALNGINGFIWELASHIARSLKREHQIAIALPNRDEYTKDSRNAFETTFLDSVWQNIGDRHILLMLDEAVRLEEQVKSGKLEPEVFQYLRHLMQHYERLNFLFSLGSGLEEMEKEYAFLFNVALYKKISFLDKTSAKSLIVEPVKNYYSIEKLAEDHILDITSGHPYYIQLVCHCLFNYCQSHALQVVQVEDVDAIVDEAAERGLAVLKHVWEESTPGEKAVLAGIAEAQSQGKSATRSDILHAWADQNVVIPKGELSGAIKSLISREVIYGQEQFAYSVKLQYLWVQKYRRLDWVKDEIDSAIETWAEHERAIASITTKSASRRNIPYLLAAISIFVVWYAFLVGRDVWSGLVKMDPTRTPTAVQPSRVLPSETAVVLHPSETNIPEPIANIVYYDDFNASKYDGDFSHELWAYWHPSHQDAVQENGKIKFQSSLPTSLYALRYEKTPLAAPIIFESKIQMKSSTEIGSGTLEFDGESGSKVYLWGTQCGLVTPNTAFCQMEDQAGIHKYKKDVNVDVSQWHTFRIVIDPSTKVIDYFLDGSPFGNTTLPVDDEAYYKFIIGIYPVTGETEAHFDDVLINIDKAQPSISGTSISSIVEERPDLHVESIDQCKVRINGNLYNFNDPPPLWDWGDGTQATSGWLAQEHTYEKNGIYQLIVTSSSGKKWALTYALDCSLPLGGVTPVIPAEAAQNPDPGEMYIINSAYSSYSIQPLNGSTVENTPLVQNRYLQYAYQKWQFEPLSGSNDGLYRIQLSGTHMCMQVDDGVNENFTLIVLNTCASADSQSFRIDSLKYPYIRLVAKSSLVAGSSGKAVDIPQMQTNGYLMQWDLDQSINQMLYLTKANPSPFPAAAPQTSRKILFDHGHSEWIKIGESYLGFAETLRSKGYIVDQTEQQEITDAILDQYDVLFIGTAWGEFKKNEINTIARFVEKGGGLFITGLGWSWVSPDKNRTLENYPPNQIASRFGFRFLGDAVCDPSSHLPNEGACFPLYLDQNKHVVMQQVKTVGGAITAAPILIFDKTKAFPILTTGPDGYSNDREYPAGGFVPVAVGAEYGQGRIIALGHEAFLEDVDPDNNKETILDEFDNKQFGLNAIQWLLKQ